MRSGSQKRAGSRDPWGYLVTTSRDIGVYTWSTLHHFDSKVDPTAKTGSLIPCERRLRKMEISIFQELTFEARFGNRDYGRPFRHILVTLRGFD